MDSVDVHFVAQELSKLADAKVEKVYCGDRKDCLIVLYLRDHPKIHLRIQVPDLICNETEKPEFPTTPPAFAMLLRKHLRSARLTGAHQVGFDRIIVLEFAQTRLIAEFIPPGNIILVVDDKIKGLAQSQNYKDRTLRGGIAYDAPPASFDPRKDDLRERIVSSEKSSIVTALAIDVGLGGVYAEEVLARANIDKSRDDLSSEEIDRVVKTIGSLLASDICACTDGKRIYPVAMSSRKCTPIEGSFLAALAANVKRIEKTQEKEKVSKKDKLATMRSAQEAHLVTLEKDIESAQKSAERIYEEYQLVSDILQAIQQARAAGGPIDLSRFPQAKKYEPKTGMLEVDLE